MDITLELIQKLTQIVVDQKLDSIKLGELEIKKTRHNAVLSDPKEEDTKRQQNLADVLFAASGVKPPPDFDLNKMFQDPFIIKDK